MDQSQGVPMAAGPPQFGLRGRAHHSCNKVCLVVMLGYVSSFVWGHSVFWSPSPVTGGMLPPAACANLPRASGCSSEPAARNCVASGEVPRICTDRQGHPAQCRSTTLSCSACRDLGFSTLSGCTDSVESGPWQACLVSEILNDAFLGAGAVHRLPQLAAG